jgi:2-polyprenyl-6-methoxyphenol hydroxylase-like FAD-dependent oxidoreductase
MTARPPLRVAVAGGSIGGLCAGIALNGIGTDVQVFERQPGPMETRGAGIVVQDDLTSLLRQHNAPDLPTTGCRIRRYLRPGDGDGQVQPMPQRFTSWDAIYKTLRATFPDERYHMGAHVSGFDQIGDTVTVALDDRDPATVDLLVCADGAGSPSRRRLLPDVEPRYAGYIAWRGTLDEAEAPSDLVSFFDDAFTFSEARSGGHMLAYLIPGGNADPTPGKRRLNWVWYVHADQEDLDRLLIDRNGQRHHGSLPQGLTPEDTVRDLCRDADREVHATMAALVAATPDPFIQTIVDVTVPQTLFGRVTLLGDAAFVVRPHTAAAAAKAAHDATALANALRRARQNVDAGLRSAQDLQLDLGRGLSEYGQALGKRWAKVTP